MEAFNNFHRLTLFLEVADSKSFSKAAKKLRISQPAVSRQINQLESEVGVRLLDRSNRQVSLTEAGQELYNAGQKVQESLDFLRSGASSLAGGYAGVLKIGASSVWEYLLPQIFAGFTKKYPKLSIEMAVSNSSQVSELVRTQHSNLGFVSEIPINSELEAMPVAEDEIILVASVGSKLADKERVQPSELNGVSFVESEPESATSHFSREFLGSLGVEPSVIMRLGSQEAVKMAVRSGIGIGMVSKFAVQQELLLGTLREVPLAAPKCVRSLYYIRNRSRFFSLAQRALLSAVTNWSGFNN